MALLAVAVPAILILAACVPSSPQPLSSEVGEETERVSEALESIDGVEDAEVTVVPNGPPGTYSATTTLTVTLAGDAALGEVLRQAASVIWAEYGTRVPEYAFDVAAPSPDGITPYELVDLEDRDAELGFTDGTYLGGTLVLTDEELASMFGASE